MLIDSGLEIMVTNLYGETPLHLACRRGNIGLSTSISGNGLVIILQYLKVQVGNNQEMVQLVRNSDSKNQLTIGY